MKKAKVFLVEDENALREMEKRFIEMEGHEVVLIACSRQEALDSLVRVKELGVDVAVLDGNLGTGKDDGPTIARALKGTMAGIKTISFSGDVVDFGDKNLRKPQDIGILGQTVTELI